jgi:hypothetical protein
VVDGLEQVAHEAGQFPVEVLHLVGWGAQHRVADLADGADGHARQSLNRRIRP